MSKQKCKQISIKTHMERFATEELCREYLAKVRWPEGFVCPKCGGRRYCKLSNGLYQCSNCRRQTSVTAGTFMHRSHVPLTKWFLALYLVTQDKRGISAMQLAFSVSVNYKTAWLMLRRIRAAMGKRDGMHLLGGIVEFDDTYIGSTTTGKKRGRGTEKAKVFVALSLNEKGKPEYLKMRVTDNIQGDSVKAFAKGAIRSDAMILSDGYVSYIPGLKDFNHQPEIYDSDSRILRWLHTIISNAKAFIQGTYHGLPQKYLQSYLDEFCYRFSRRNFGAKLFDRLAIAMVDFPKAELNG